MTTDTIGTGSRLVSPITPASAAAVCAESLPGLESSPRRIDEGDDWQLEVAGQAQHPLRLAECARSGRLTTLAGDERRRDAANATKPGDHRRIIVPGAVAVQLDPLRDQPGEVIASARPLGMTGKPGLLPPRDPAPRRDRLPGGERRRGERSVKGCCRPVLAPVGEERHENPQRLAQAVRPTMPSSMPLASSSSAVPAVSPPGCRPPGPILAPGSARMMSAWFASAAQAAPVAGCASTLTNGTPARWSRAAAAAILGAWIEPQQPLLGARAAGGAEGDEGRRRAAAVSMARRIFSPATGPMLGAEEGVVQDDHHGFATADRAVPVSTASLTPPLGPPNRSAASAKAIGNRQQVAENERVERDQSGVRLPEAPLIDQQPQSLAAWNGEMAMATGADTVGLEGVGAGQLDATGRAGQRLLAEAGFSVRCGARIGNVQRKGLSREIRVAGAWVMSHWAPPRWLMDGGSTRHLCVASYAPPVPSSNGCETTSALVLNPFL